MATDLGTVDRQDTLVVGERLRRSREAHGWGYDDICNQLNMDVWMVQALEQDDFVALGAPVFTKGHLRKYSDLLGLPTDEILTAYYRTVENDDAPALQPDVSWKNEQSAEVRRARLAPILIFLVVAVLVLGVAWWVKDNGLPNIGISSSVDTVPTSRGETQALALPSAYEAALDEVVSSSSEQDIAETESAANEAETENAAAQAALLAEPMFGELVIAFSDQAWIEVYDHTGERLLYDMAEAGRTESLIGEPPFELVIGNGSAVTLTFNGESVDVPKRSRGRRTVRLQVPSE